jgi:crotonobetainyl-CoA:carnitine CoA-transferase CaiB-like acyl-CoA transferase
VSAGALSGLRVLDLTRYIPGPYATLVLADLGADVVKVEEGPVGDPTRVVPPAVGGDGVIHAALNRNKRSVLVDWRSESGADVVRRLAARADVLVETFRPGVLDRRGLGAAALCAANPRLVYCSITGYGSADGRAGHDVNYAAVGGFLGGNRGADGDPVLPQAQVADMSAGMNAVIGILAALHARERTGRGQTVTVSLRDSVVGLMTVPLTRQLAGGPGRSELTGTHACYHVYRCRDGRHVSVGALEPKFWESLCRALGREDLVGRQWEREPERERTIDALAAIFATRDRDEWVRALASADACVEPVLDAVEAAQANARALMDQPSGDAWLRTVASPIGLGETPASVRRPAPGLGEHTSEVLAELGYDQGAIEALRGEGAVA